MTDVIQIETAEGPRRVAVERMSGGWALHRAHDADGWVVTWAPTGLGIDTTGGTFDRADAESLYEMVTTKWPHWPRRKPGQRLTPRIKRATLAELQADYLAWCASRFSERGGQSR